MHILLEVQSITKTWNLKSKSVHMNIQQTFSHFIFWKLLICVLSAYIFFLLNKWKKDIAQLNCHIWKCCSHTITSMWVSFQVVVLKQQWPIRGEDTVFSPINGHSKRRTPLISGQFFFTGRILVKVS